ncbi:hypothetical protein X963_3218 [Burkholderia pseudomallei MSHR7498]|nr:hypothetical protein DO64_4789 [Burkholderia pseudomallei]KGS90059.1 hypothetical protein X947_1739 [Burkholderia pseudomallei MSHR7334]KGS95198.1 hypothetical protein X963_3218 [Burkholderia pseudomallei MSHR7498]KGW31251.1 hypothetical protein Y602_3579 [Burkholderia pseudomallei MSHR733]KGW92024.1 hypothetical protein Y048_4501 [Burkholderia pseudomallei MSHR456]KGX46951.1 hypothetical protein Y043_5736 [Burkholderia pseudomallei MSHR2138]KGX98994.1 hypothetical protein Y023_4038 [Burkh
MKSFPFVAIQFHLFIDIDFRFPIERLISGKLDRLLGPLYRKQRNQCFMICHIQKTPFNQCGQIATPNRRNFSRWASPLQLAQNPIS